MAWTGLRCAECGVGMLRQRTSLPQGEARCQACRRASMHGTSTGASRGCPCEPCREFKRQQWRDANPQSGKYHVCSEPTWKPRARLCAACRDERKRAKRARIGHERRAKEYGSGAERFSPLDVYERDKWTCHICRKPVSRSAVAPDPGSPSLDHLMPLSLGGEHTRANVALAHLGCNVAKGARGNGEQLALIG